MSQYIVYESHLVPPKKKGDFPDLVYFYISNSSAIGFHYDITDKREDAYIWDDFELDKAKFIADVWDMKIKRIDDY